MKMATGLEVCDDESDIVGERSDEERDPNTVEERFRVDRRKLEQMLQGLSCIRSSALSVLAFVLQQSLEIRFRFYNLISPLQYSLCSWPRWNRGIR